MFTINQEVALAEQRIRQFIRETPVEHSIALSKLAGSNVFLKCENLQYTNAFKVRGALNKLLSLTPAQCAQGIVTASSGNHGAAVAFGLNKLSLGGIVFVPENASSAKVATIRNYDIPVEFYGEDCLLTEQHALDYAKQHAMSYIPPYDDLQVIAGQGTIAIELLRQVNPIDAVFVPIGGGGLISGIASYLKAYAPKIEIIGCLPKNSPVMAESIKAGKIVAMATEETLSDATAGGIIPGAMTFEICQQFVDDYLLVSEEAIQAAIIALLKHQRLVIEGAAAVAVAALLENASKFQHKNVVIILSGANISLETLQKILH